MSGDVDHWRTIALGHQPLVQVDPRHSTKVNVEQQAPEKGTAGDCKKILRGVECKGVKPGSLHQQTQ